MDQEDDHDGLFVVSVDDLGITGLWASVRNLLESRSTLSNLTLHNKVGRAVPVERLSLQFVASGDRRLQRLRPFAHSPVVWFRHPYAHLLLVSTADASEYRNSIKPALKRAISDLERDWGGPPAPGPPPPQPSGMGALLGGGAATAPAPVGVLGAEWVIVYVRPAELDVADKAAKKLFEKLKDDFSGRGRTRVLRMDVPRGHAAMAGLGMARGASGPVGLNAGMHAGFGPSAATGLEELEVCLRDCVRNSFDARQAAYMAEVQRLVNERRDPNWSFASLYLVKDSLALLLEGCGLHLDAYKEYVELEAAYQETLDRRAPGGPEKPADAGDGGDKYGAAGEGAEVATLTSASWRATRRSILKQAAVQEFQFRQYLFASQARLLLRLGRPVDVAERGLRFIGATAAELSRREQLASGGVRPLLKEAWTFTACLAVISSVTASVYGRDPLGGCGREPVAPSRSGNAPSLSTWNATGAVDGAGAAAGPAVAVDAAFVEADDAADGASAVDAAAGWAHHASAGATGSAELEPVDWQIWLPFEADVPRLDPSALCGQATTPAALAASRPMRESANSGEPWNGTQAYMLALAHLYITACSALLRLAGRAAARASAQGQAGGGEGAGSDDEWSAMTRGWREGLHELASQYPCRGVVGMFVDQEEDRQFEATPQQQATQLQLLRQAVSAMSTAGDSGDHLTSRTDQQSPPQGVANPYRAESLYSLSMSAAAPSQYGGAGALGSVMDASDSTVGSWRPGSSSGTGNRPQVSWAADLDGAASQRTSASTARGRHQHSSSADNASGSVFSKLDVSSKQWASTNDPLKVPRSGQTSQGSGRPELGSPPYQVGDAASGGALIGAEAEQLNCRGALDGTPSGSDAAAPSAAGGFLPEELGWISDRRLQLALSSPRHCGDLALRLALAAASCFSRAGRHRAAAQVFGDVGAVLLERGQAEMAAGLMEHVVALAQAEGWHAVLGRALPILMAAQQAIGHVLLPYTCISYLSLPAHVCQRDVRHRILELLLSSAGCHPATSTSGERPRQLAPLSSVLMLGTEQAVMEVGMSNASSALSLGPAAMGTAPSYSNLSDSSGMGRRAPSLPDVLSAASISTQPPAPGAFGSVAHPPPNGSAGDLGRPSRSLQDVAAGSTGGPLSPSSTQGGAASGWIPGEDLACWHLVRVRHIQPGLTQLTFRVAPTKPGLYFVRGVSASLGTYDIRIPVVAPQRLADDVRALSHGWGALPARGHAAMGPNGSAAGKGGGFMFGGLGSGSAAAGTAAALAALGRVADGEVGHLDVALQVAPLQPPLEVAPVAVGGALVAGLPQWLGIALLPHQAAAAGGADRGGADGAGAPARAEHGAGGFSLAHARLHVQTLGSPLCSPVLVWLPVWVPPVALGSDDQAALSAAPELVRVQQAIQMPDMRVLVSVSITSNLSLPAVVSSLALEPQYGLQLSMDSPAGQHADAALPGILPLRLAPCGSAMWAFVLSRSEQALPGIQSLHLDDACVLYMSYALVPGGAGATAAAEALASSGPRPGRRLNYPLPPPVPSGTLGDAGGALSADALPPGTPSIRPVANQPPAPLDSAPSYGGCFSVYSHGGPLAPAGGQEAAAAGGSGATGLLLSFRHGFVLEFPASSALTHNLVSVRLLGPHAGVLGQPLHLTWLVTRVSAPPASATTTSGGASAGGSSGADGGADVAIYEVTETAEGRAGGPGGAAAPVLASAAEGVTATNGGGRACWQWRQGVGCRGSIHLGRAKGSVAVIEAAVLPLSAGVLLAPALRLRGLREVRDEDAGAKDYVVVSEGI
ncbi:hypothetical protein GPECTOR_119g395 [Gonium pectorale]|uniref:TRAPPC10/Trs130 N-terminal domain-containing protein n=1 Tax=Gonium pectorale TaxID=33097 RepID=A0A150FYT3_GONPE|nr:hypothetical protein GPECTOR_119g395 [Gonium pectorale]|eukprot:KXZ42764.1 hypothetical protein GPECTOR_119g395 [Gonium pectorale]